MHKLRFGQMLLEMVLAIAITGMVMVAVAQITTQGLAGSNFSKSRTEANLYATEVVEWMRNRRDTDPLFFTTYYPAVSADYCFSDKPIAVPIPTGICGNPITGTQFFRNVKLTRKNVATSGKQVEVSVVVSWKEGSSTADHKVTQVVNLAQY